MLLWSTTPNMLFTIEKAASEICVLPQVEGMVRLSSLKFGHPLDVQVPLICTGEDLGVLPLGAISMQERRMVAFPYTGEKENKAPLLMLSVICVAVQDESGRNADGLPEGVPVPMIVIPMPPGTTMPLVQMQVPDGITIVSPLTALCVEPLMTAFTSD